MKNKDLELLDVLNAISIVSERLANNLSKLSPCPRITEEIIALYELRDAADTVTLGLRRRRAEALLADIRKDLA